MSDKIFSALLELTARTIIKKTNKEKGKRKNYHADNLLSDKIFSAPLKLTARTAIKKTNKTKGKRKNYHADNFLGF